MLLVLSALSLERCKRRVKLLEIVVALPGVFRDYATSIHIFNSLLRFVILLV